MEFFDLVGHLERVLNSLMSNLRLDERINYAVEPGAEFAGSGDTLILAGYSRLSNGLEYRRLSYDRAIQRWIFSRVRPTVKHGERTIIVFGDKPSRGILRHEILKLLTAKGAQIGDSFDFEPLEALAGLLGRPQSPVVPTQPGFRPRTVGGAPQLVRVTPGASASQFAVQWNDNAYLMGRSPMPRERMNVPLMTLMPKPAIHAPEEWSVRGSAVVWPASLSHADNVSVTDLAGLAAGGGSIERRRPRLVLRRWTSRLRRTS